MAKYTTVSGQTWQDISLALYGNMDRSIELAYLNGYSIIDNLLGNIEIDYIDTNEDILINSIKTYSTNIQFNSPTIQNNGSAFSKAFKKDTFF